MDIHLGRTNTALCLITATLVYLARRNREAGPLFLCTDGMPLPMQQLVKEVGAALDAGFLCQFTQGTALGLEPQPHLQN